MAISLLANRPSIAGVRRGRVVRQARVWVYWGIAVSLLSATPIRASAQLIGSWSNPFGEGNSPNRYVDALATDEAGGLFIGGAFDSIGSVPVSRIAHWNGFELSDLDGGLFGTGARVAALLQREGVVYAAGAFCCAGEGMLQSANFAAWDGSAWFSMGDFSPDPQYLTSIRATDDHLYVGGSIHSRVNGVKLFGVGDWNGSGWNLLSNGLYTDNPNGSIAAMGVLGSGVVAVGSFKWEFSGTPADPAGQDLNYVARWDGSSWHPLGTGLDAPAVALLVEDDGQSAVVGGQFMEAGGIAASHIARWTGVSWEPIGDGLSGNVYALAIYADALYAGGNRLGQLDDGSWAHLMRWKDGLWEAVPGSPQGNIFELMPIGDSLMVAGSFENIAETGANFIATWRETSATRRTRPEGLPNASPGLSVFPNPAADHARVVLSGAVLESGTLEVFDLIGRRLMAEEMRVVPGERFEFGLDLTGFPTGPLFIRFRDGMTTASCMLLRP